MARFEDSPELFGVGCGQGSNFREHCDFCGAIHNPDIDAENDRNDGLMVNVTTFAGKHVCECCFEKIEAEILRRMPDILPWYKRILASHRRRLETDEAEIKAIDDSLQDIRILGMTGY